MPNTWKLGAIALVGLVAACGPSVEPRLEASPTLGIAVDAAATPRAIVKSGWEPTWEPSWTRPDATIVLTGSRCDQDGDVRVLGPGVLAFEFVNESHLEGLFRVARLGRGQRRSDLWDDVLPLIGRRSSRFLGPSTTEIWSSSREITSGRWAVLCWKDRIASPNGFQMDRVGIVGPIEVG